VGAGAEVVDQGNAVLVVDLPPEGRAAGAHLFFPSVVGQERLCGVLAAVDGGEFE
jgi:hypothetical protein